MNGERLHENPVYGAADAVTIQNCTFKFSPTLQTFDSTSRTIWVEPQHVETSGPVAVLEFGVIVAWSIVLAAFLSDYCWGKR